MHSQYTLHGEMLESVDCGRYVEVSLTNDLCWNTLQVRLVKRNICTKNPSVKELAYKTLVRPQVEYASTVCSPYTKKNQIEMVRRRAVLWVSNNYSPYDSAYLQCRVTWAGPSSNIVVMTPDFRCFKIYHGLVAMPTVSYFEHPSRFTRLFVCLI